MRIQLANLFEQHWFVMYTSLLEVEHEGGSHNESSIEIEEDDLLAELFHHVVRVRLHQNVTAVCFKQFVIACCGILYH